MKVYSEIIKNFSKQFEWQPEIVRLEANLPSGFLGVKKIVIVGMGGSGLVGGLLKIFKPDLDIIIHRDYGLPALPDLNERLVILNSYSGNTEEVLDSFGKTLKISLRAAVISTGGKLIELAKSHSIPFIQLPNVGLQPRMALGHQIKALLEIIGDKEGLKQASESANLLNPQDYEDAGKNLAQKLKDFIPVIYSSARNSAVAYAWKVKFNETSKIPAFCNVFPELNHNEMNGFTNKNLSRNFYFIFLKDDGDNPRIQKRTEATAKLFKEKNLPIEVLELNDKNIFHKIFSSLILADWTSYYLAEEYGVDPEQVAMVEEFKKSME